MKLSLFYLVIGIAFANCAILLAPGYKEVTHTWDELIGTTLEEAKRHLSTEFPGVEFVVFQEEDLPEEFYFNKIKIVVNKTNQVIQAPKFFGHEPDFRRFGDLLGKNFSEVLEILRSVIKEKIVIKLVNGVDYFTAASEAISSNNYVHLTLDFDLNVVELPRYVRVSSVEELLGIVQQSTEGCVEESTEGSLHESQESSLPD